MERWITKLIDINRISGHEHIVFGYEHYNPLGLIRSLGEYGIKSTAIIIKNVRSISSKSKYIKQLHLVDSIEEGYQVLITQYASQECKPYIYTSDDKITSYLDDKYDELKDRFYFFNAGMRGRITEFMDKYNICQLAQKHGLPLANTVVAERGEIPVNLSYPIITKAIVSTLDNWKDDVFICHNEQELVEAYKHIRSPKVLLQKYVEKKNELCLDGYCVNRGKDVAITIASTYNYILADGYSHYMTVESLKNEELENKIRKMFTEIGFEGIFSLEFLVGQDDELYFLEINFRNSTWSYASTCAQMPLPIMWALDMKAQSIDRGKVKKIDSPFMAMVEFDDLRNRVKTGQISIWTWLRDFGSSKCKFYFVKNDLKPFISVIMSKVGRR